MAYTACIEPHVGRLVVWRLHCYCRVEPEACQPAMRAQKVSDSISFYRLLYTFAKPPRKKSGARFTRAMSANWGQPPELTSSTNLYFTRTFVDTYTQIFFTHKRFTRTAFIYVHTIFLCTHNFGVFFMHTGNFATTTPLHTTHTDTKHLQQSACAGEEKSLSINLLTSVLFIQSINQDQHWYQYYWLLRAILPPIKFVHQLENVFTEWNCFKTTQVK